MGELFGKNLQSEGTGDSNGQQQPRLDLDLDAGVIRLSGTTPPRPEGQDTEE